MSSYNTSIFQDLKGKADPAWLWDSDRGRIVWANHAGIKFWGEASLFDLLDHRFDLDGATVKKIREIAGKLGSNDGAGNEVIFFAEAGQLVKCKCSVTPLEDGRDGILIAAARTGGKKQQAGDGLMEQIVDHTPFALAVFDRAGQLVFANPALKATITPSDPEAERGAKGNNFALAQWLGSEDAAHELVSRILLVGSHSEARSLETKFGQRTHRLTARRISSEDGETSILIVLQDIEDRRKYERELQARLEMLESAAEDSGNGPPEAEPVTEEQSAEEPVDDAETSLDSDRQPDSHEDAEPDETNRRKPGKAAVSALAVGGAAAFAVSGIASSDEEASGKSGLESDNSETETPDKERAETEEHGESEPDIRAQSTMEPEAELAQPEATYEPDSDALTESEDDTGDDNNSNHLRGRDKAAFNAIAEALRVNNPVTAEQIRIDKGSEIISLTDQKEPAAEADAHDTDGAKAIESRDAAAADNTALPSGDAAEDQEAEMPSHQEEAPETVSETDKNTNGQLAPNAESSSSDLDSVVENRQRALDTVKATPEAANNEEVADDESSQPADEQSASADDSESGEGQNKIGFSRLAEEETAEDIFPATEVKETESNRLKTILDSAVDGIVTLDGKGRICDMNASAEAILGIKAHEVINQPFTGFLNESSARTTKNYLEAVTETGVAGPYRDGREIEAEKADGSTVSLFMTIGPVTSDDTLEYCAVIRDISQWKNAETELRLAKERAEQDNEKKSDFLARISHELRTPLNAIMGFSEVMSEEKFGPIANDRYKGYVSDIRNSSEHLLSLVNDLLDLSKIESGNLELNFASVNLTETVNQCVNLMQPQATRERIVMRTSMPDNLPPVVADHRSLRQIVLNLLSNAVKFTSTGGQVIVSAQFGEDGEIRLQVRDTGIGMSETELKKAMEPYRQIKAVNEDGQPGTGLGLPLTKALAEANRAEFHISSEKDAGTLVQIVFPTTRVLAE